MNPGTTTSPPTPFWASEPGALATMLESSPGGLSSTEAQQRQVRRTRATGTLRPRTGLLRQAANQVRSPLVLLLLGAAGLSFYLHETVDAAIILGIVVVSGCLGAMQEHSAARAVERLLDVVQVRTRVRRDGVEVDVAREEIVPGDVVLLAAGDIVPGDCRILECRDLHADEAALTGETFPAEKEPGTLPADVPLARRRNSLFMGTHIVTGTARAMVVTTGAGTEFGRISARLAAHPPETEFERGVRRFGYLLLEITLSLVIAIFAINVFLNRPAMDSFLFALALAVGLTPQLLPAIISVNLAHGARRMAACQVIVRRLAAIENFGSMTHLCSDKTGTLTEGVVQLKSATDITGSPSARTLRLAWLNTVHQAGYANPIDTALRAAAPPDPGPHEKRDELPYDFHRRRISVLVDCGGERWMITKGWVPGILDICSRAESPQGGDVALEAVKEGVTALFDRLSQDGYRTLGVAVRRLDGESGLTREHEAGMTFVGFLVFTDPLRPGVSATLQELRELGVRLKIITGDSHRVATHVSREAGLSHPRVITGPALRRLSEPALVQRAPEIDVFAEVEPDQKERIILALRKAGAVVGYLGDGINDIPALHAADVGISVSSAVDAAREAADLVLLDRDLAVLKRGVLEGRATFANTLKYVFMATSANFGNMFSMAGASLFLPFLPLLPKQILLLNLLTDLPEMAIATDTVDHDWLSQPRRWNLDFIRRFMVTFGLVSSLFDYLTFAALLGLAGMGPAEFRSAWFVESAVSATLIVLVIRTRQPLRRSRPSPALLGATAVVIAASAGIPFTPLAPVLGFAPLRPATLATLAGIIAAYLVTASLVKRSFHRRVNL